MYALTPRLQHSDGHLFLSSAFLILFPAWVVAATVGVVFGGEDTSSNQFNQIVIGVISLLILALQVKDRREQRAAEVARQEREDRKADELTKKVEEQKKEVVERIAQKEDTVKQMFDENTRITTDTKATLDQMQHTFEMLFRQRLAEQTTVPTADKLAGIDSTVRDTNRVAHELKEAQGGASA